MPTRRAGAYDMRSATSAQVSRPVRTNSSATTASAVSRPSIPMDASHQSACFVSGACGAWSVPITSIVPSASASRIASTSAMERRGGLTLYAGLPVWAREWSSMRWCGVTSAVIGRPCDFAHRTIITVAAVEMWQAWTRHPSSAPMTASRATMTVSAMLGQPGSPRASATPASTCAPGVSSGSCACWARTPPSLAISISASRMTSERETHLPSSENIRTPTAPMPAMSASRWPSSPMVTAPMGTTSTSPTSLPRRRSYSQISGVSATGTVFGIAHTAPYPPRAAASEPVSIVSAVPGPGSRRCVWGSTSAGRATSPLQSTRSSVPSGSTISPSRIARSRTPKPSTSSPTNSVIRPPLSSPGRYRKRIGSTLTVRGLLTVRRLLARRLAVQIPSVRAVARLSPVRRLLRVAGLSVRSRPVARHVHGERVVHGAELLAAKLVAVHDGDERVPQRHDNHLDDECHDVDSRDHDHERAAPDHVEDGALRRLGRHRRDRRHSEVHHERDRLLRSASGEREHQQVAEGPPERTLRDIHRATKGREPRHTLHRTDLSHVGELHTDHEGSDSDNHHEQGRHPHPAEHRPEPLVLGRAGPLVDDRHHPGERKDKRQEHEGDCHEVGQHREDVQTDDPPDVATVQRAELTHGREPPLGRLVGAGDHQSVEVEGDDTEGDRGDEEAAADEKDGEADGRVARPGARQQDRKQDDRTQGEGHHDCDSGDQLLKPGKAQESPDPPPEHRERGGEDVAQAPVSYTH